MPHSRAASSKGNEISHFNVNVRPRSRDGFRVCGESLALSFRNFRRALRRDAKISGHPMIHKQIMTWLATISHFCSLYCSQTGGLGRYISIIATISYKLKAVRLAFLLHHTTTLNLIRSASGLHVTMTNGYNICMVNSCLHSDRSNHWTHGYYV